MAELDRGRWNDPAYMAQRIAVCEREIQKGIVGQRGLIRQVMLAMLTGGNVLLEGMPGLGKTRLVSTIGKVFDLSFKRIQFTPDLMPSDVTGTNIIIKNGQGSSFSFERGPVFANLILADEINRATPRTQAGLLECMEERQVTIDGETYISGDPFFVIATQNPVETTGTFPLPEAQMDRFMMRLSMGLPTKEEELDILSRYMEKEPLEELSGVLTLQELQQAKQEVTKIFVHRAIQEYMVDIVSATRNEESILMGVSPRGSLALLRCAKAYAWLEGRQFVIPDDIKAVAVPTLAHRLLMDFGRNDSRESTAYIRKILEQTPVPTEDFQA